MIHLSKRWHRRQLAGAAKAGEPLRFRDRPPIRWQWWVVGLLTIVFVAVASLYVYGRVLAIHQIVIDQEVMVKPPVVPLAQIQQKADTARGLAIVPFNEVLFAQSIQKMFPSLASVTVTKRYPSTLIVAYTPRVAVCVLTTPHGSFLVDRNGILFASAPASMQGVRLPVLTTNQTTDSQLGNAVSVEGVILGVALAKDLRLSSPVLQQMTLHDGQLDVQFSSPPVVYVDDSKQPEQVVEVIKVLFDTFAQDKRYPNVVDLRYDRPVLRY